MWERIQRSRKPVVGCLLGLDRVVDCGPNFHQTKTIDQAVEQALLLCTGSGDAARFLHQAPAKPAQMEQEVQKWLPEQRYLRGLFAGGTFCYQAQQVLQSTGIPVFSNAPLDPRYRLENPEESLEHSLLDLGTIILPRESPTDDRFSERVRRILKEADDPEVAILLLDFVLGEIASRDPVGDLAEALRQAQGKVARVVGHLTVVASICGTDQDSQNLGEQRTACLR